MRRGEGGTVGGRRGSCREREGKEGRRTNRVSFVRSKLGRKRSMKGGTHSFLSMDGWDYERLGVMKRWVGREKKLIWREGGEDGC